MAWQRFLLWAHERSRLLGTFLVASAWGGLRGFHRPPRRSWFERCRVRAGSGQTLVDGRCEATADMFSVRNRGAHETWEPRSAVHYGTAVPRQIAPGYG